MKRLLLTIVCCSSFLFYPSINFALDLTGPSGESAVISEQYGPISSVETLWGISTKLRPNRSVSVQQTLLAIYKANPYAFSDGNINKLIPKSVIIVPTLEFIQAQTDKEASALIAKYSRQKKVANNNKKTIPAVTVKTNSQSKINADLLTEQNKALTKNNLASQKEIELAQKKLQTLQNDLDLSHEQLVLSTEENQVLKLKLQPLRDELALVNEQLESVLATQEQQQKVIDDYRAQLDAVKALPFSGEGLFNEILRWITGSLANLLIVITSPVLLLMACFVIFQRIRAKRLLAAQEQELAESTAMLMEESGQYDTLLSDDIYDDLEPEVDFSSDDSLAQEVSSDELAASVNEIESQQSIQPDESLDSINLEDPSDAAVEIADAQDSITTADDPFGIAALAEDNDFASSVDLDDPFDVGQLSEEEDLISSVDLDDPFGIAALAEEEDLISGVDLDHAEELTAAQQADQDLAAQWESQISAQPEVPAVDLDLAELQEPDEFALAEAMSPEIAAVEPDINEQHDAEAFDLAEAMSPEIAAVDLDNNGQQDAEAFDLAEARSPEIAAVDLDNNGQQDAEEFDLAEVMAPEIAAVEQDISEQHGAEEFDLAEAMSPEIAAVALDNNGQQDAEEFDLAEAMAPEIAAVALDNNGQQDAEEFDLAEALSPAIPAAELDISEQQDSEEFSLAEAMQAEIPAIEQDIDELQGLEEFNLTEVSQPETADVDLDISESQALDELSSVDTVQTDVSVQSVKAKSTATDLDLAEIEALADLDEMQADISPVENINDDALAKKLSDVAFNADVPLPKIKAEHSDAFIDIETLLDNSAEANNDEPYEEIDFDLDLNNFPDVVNAEQGIDIDDDENGISAQLDLARAYLEIDDKEGAKEILLAIADIDNSAQRTEVDKLLSRLA